ncbi:MAG: hypothetical protein ACO3J2_08250 [Chthoniobacterales bacterium]|jgi:hypothetical protein
MKIAALAARSNGFGPVFAGQLPPTISSIFDSTSCGDTETDGKKLPVGLQIMAPAFEEARLLRIARAYEAASTT